MKGESYDSRSLYFIRINMKIFFAPSGYPNEIYPLANTFLQEQVEALANAGHEVIVLNVAQKGLREYSGKMNRRIEAFTSGHNIIEYRIWLYTFLQEKLPNLYVARCEKAICKLFHEAYRVHGKPDVIYAHFGFYAGYAMSKIGKQHGISVVVQEHYSYLMGDKVSKPILRYVREAIYNSTIYCCVSDNLRNCLIRKEGLNAEVARKLVILENMLNRKFSFAPLPGNDRFVFFSVGNMNPRKNFSLLIEAFCIAFGPEEKVELRIGGDGEERENLIQLVENKNRNHQISFLGALSRDEVYEENRKSNCFALMSKKETFGIVYREALAVGRPIISSNHGGFDTPIDAKDGIQVDSFVAEDVADAMKTVKEHYDSYDLQGISKRCLLRYSEEVKVPEIIRILNDAIGREKNDQ